MEKFLQIVGAIVLGFLVLVGLLIGIGYFYLRQKLGQYRGSLGMMLDTAKAVSQSVPPFRIKLEPANHRDFVDGESLESICKEIETRGGVRIGRFVTRPETVLLEAWHIPQHALAVTIYEHANAGTWIDVGSRFQDETDFCFCSGPNHHMGSPPWSTFEFRTGTPAGELIDAAIAEGPDKAAIPTSADEFAGRFEAAWARDMDWRIARGGPSEEELRHTLKETLASEADSGEEAASSFQAAGQLEIVQQIRSIWQERIDEHQETQIREAYIVESGVSALDWDRMSERVFFIHDNLSARDLAEHLELYLSEDNTDPDDPDEDGYEQLVSDLTEQLQNQSARTVFTEWVANLTSSDQHEKIGEVVTPIESDVWLAPIGDDE